MNKIQAINSKITDVKVGMEAILSIGGDTQSLRITLGNLEAQLAHAEREAADEERARQQELAERADQRAAESAHMAHQSLVDAAGAAVVAGVRMPEPEIDPTIADAAARLSAARERLAREQAVYAGQLAEVTSLQSRVDAKEGARREILSRRVAGDERPHDPTELHLLAEDISTLKELISRARATAEQHRPGTSERLVADAEQALAAAQARAVFSVKMARTRELEAAFLAAHAELVAAGAAIGQRNQFALYRASDALRRITYGTV